MEGARDRGAGKSKWGRVALVGSSEAGNDDCVGQSEAIVCRRSQHRETERAKPTNEAAAITSTSTTTRPKHGCSRCAHLPTRQYRPGSWYFSFYLSRLPTRGIHPFTPAQPPANSTALDSVRELLHAFYTRRTPSVSTLRYLWRALYSSISPADSLYIFLCKGNPHTRDLILCFY